MLRLAFKLLLSFAILGCSYTPYLQELDDQSEQVNVEKYGKGSYYFYKSKHRFSSTNNANELTAYYADVGQYIKAELSDYENCRIIKKSLSYYSEGGWVSILIQCPAT